MGWWLGVGLQGPQHLAWEGVAAGGKGEGIIGGSGHLEVAGGLDTSEALNLPQLQGWAYEEWEH